MHRLVGARNFNQNSIHSFSSTFNTRSLNLKDIKCSFCRTILKDHNNLEKLIDVRHQSTKTASALQKMSKKKVKYKNLKKFGELLEVKDQSMTETKVSISKLRPVHLSKLASSSVTLGELHQLTIKPRSEGCNNINQVDPELLQSVKDKILNGSSGKYKEINLEDDKCALIFTSHKFRNFGNQFMTKNYIDMVKESYYNFRKATLYDQRLKDLRFAINEGLNQEFDLAAPTVPSSEKELENIETTQKSPLSVFREFFLDSQHIDGFDQEFLTHMSNFQTQGVPHPAIEEVYEDPLLHTEICEEREDFDNVEISPNVKTFNIKKAEIAAKKKARREKRRELKERSMKSDMQELEQRGKQETLNQLLVSHLQLLCSLGMQQQGQQILQYYRTRVPKNSEQLRVTEVKVYNILLHGYAALGNYNNVLKLLNYMQEDSIKANAQTFAAVFEAIERSQCQNKGQLLEKHFDILTKEGLTLNDLVDKTKFVRDQREVVIKAIKKLNPNFIPEYTPPNLDYNCTLMENLNFQNEENRKGLRQSPAEGLLPLDVLKQRAKKQFQIEIKGEIEIQNINVKDNPTDTVKYYRKKLSETEDDWRKAVGEAFIRNLSTLKSQSNASHSAITLYPYLNVLDVDQFVELIMGEISKLVDGSETYSPTLKLLQRDLGLQVYHRYIIEQYRRNGQLEKIKKIYEKYCEWYLNRHSVDGLNREYNCRQVWQTLIHQHRDGPSLDTEEAPWPVDIRQNIGKFLYNIVINDVKIDVNMFKTKAVKQKKLPAVYKIHRPWGRLVRLELKPHPVLARLWGGAARPGLRMRAYLAPVTCPAAPWTNIKHGAYLLTSTPLIRMPFNVASQWRRLEESPKESLYPILDSLNQLGEVPWVINKRILDLQLHVFRSGGSKELDIARPSSALDTSQYEIGETKASMFRRRLAINRARAEMYSLWCDSLYKLSLANHYRDEIFWLPHNMDFRGRVYACPPHLSQLGADSSRALLKFAKARPLGPKGLYWLKLHAVNLTGTMKKKTLNERLAYAESMMDKILDSADNPLGGERWWTQSEEPWQTLACCCEIANAVRSPNPEEYLCAFPVHQDGSCNGLQHYAALGGDSTGAAAVNLTPLDAPQDVYSAVAALVEEMRKRDAAQNITPAVILEGFVQRKVIKQTVMTTVYGVTKFGARLQIAKQLKDINDFPKEHVWTCSNYLTGKTFDSLREMFTSTKLIQDWLTECAKLISGVCGESVEWVTPLGLPVVQPYYRRSTVSMSPGVTVSVSSHTPIDRFQRPCTMKQKNAFPPNFIHSLDSSHMMLTALQCQARGITFVSVHDCFWTHPDTVDIMNKICREQFVALHSQPILEELSEYMVTRYSYTDSEITKESSYSAPKRRVNSLLRKVPSKGDFHLENVLKSIYFFS